MNVTENKNEATETTATATAAKKKLPLWGKILLVVVIVLAALAGLATLYVNGKLDLLHYNDGSVDSMGTIDADEDQDLDGSGLVHSDDEMTMPEGSPFADDDVLNILLIGTDERTEAVNDADAFTHLNRRQPDSGLAGHQGPRHPPGLHRARPRRAHPAGRLRGRV